MEKSINYKAPYSYIAINQNTSLLKTIGRILLTCSATISGMKPYQLPFPTIP